MHCVPLCSPASYHFFSALLWPPEKRRCGTASITKGSVSSKGCVGSVSGAVGAKCRALRHISKASMGSRRAQRRRSFTGCPEWPRMSMGPSLKPQGLPTLLKFEDSNWKSELWNCSCGRLALLGSPKPGITCTETLSHKAGISTLISRRAALMRSPSPFSGSIPPQITSCWTEWAFRNSKALPRAPATPSGFPKSRPDISAR
mmetsp:Transcript_87031/g.138042  ORF Transcript_87031/g.138042 Transcript_87031/m.138042 type:complete len:202 (-) Transcript_87031:904-1509(-)